ncbi:MAG: tetratricopeptide repeat protein [bacterium]
MLKYFFIAILFFMVITSVTAIPVRDNKTGTDSLPSIIDQYPSEPVKEPKTADDFYKIGLFYLANKKPQEARENFRKVLKIDPKHVFAMVGLTASAFNLGDIETAEEFAEKAIQTQPNSPEVRNAIGEIWLMDAKNPKYQKEAEAKFKEAASLNPNFIPARINLARLYVRMKKNDEAVREYKTAVSIQPKNPLIRQELVSFYLNSGSIDNALEEAKKVLELDPKNPVYHNALGEIYLHKNLLDEAMREFQEAIRLEPKYAPGYKNIGSIYFIKGSPDKAITEINKSLSYVPDYGDAFALLGDIHVAKGMMKEAAEYYKKALDEKAIRKLSLPSLITTYNNIAYIYSEESQNLDLALSYAQIAKQTIPGNPDIADTLGWIHYKKGNYDEALTNIKFAADGSPNNPIIRYHLGAVYYKKGIKDQAISELKKSLSISDKFPGAEDAKSLLEELEAKR